MEKVLPIMWEMVSMTWDCTQRCEYCYANHKSQEPMTKETVDQMVRYVAPLLDKHQAKVHCTVTLGGEPLLQLGNMVYMWDKFADIDTVRHVNVFYTNGDLLEKIDPWNMAFCDQIYLHVRDLSLYEILQRVAYIKACEVEPKLTWVMDEFNMGRIHDLAWFCVLNRIKPRIYYMEGRGNDTEYKKKLTEAYHSFLDVLEAYNAKYSLNNVIRHFWTSWQRDVSYTVCGRGMIRVNPDGTIYTCPRNDQTIQGSVWDDQDYYYKVAPNRWAWIKAHKNCHECDLKQVCQGDCPNERMLTHGAWDAPSPFCDVWKSVLPRAIAMDTVDPKTGDHEWVK